ncbi:terpene synthase family protein [Streptomyces millisiae]|uniref:Terpene synthase n=1 Tax=Streptomyces millisiae TaxID=3075542 RepID=A0ABU2LKE2_9ACTN|nr:terpene synthase family protein [Streptomyces sp. DSM 44918]MDT0318051.1 terpene synthase family protein [Streptomyces sp. DSM 44918]
MPIPSQPLHPRSPELEEQAYDWAARHGLVDAAGHRRLAASRVVTLATSYYRTAPYPEMALLARWYVWLLAADDWFDRAGTTEAPAPWAVFRRALAHELWPPTAEPMSAAWRRRFARHLRDCLAGYHWQAAVRLGLRPTPTLAQYVAWRRLSFGAHPIFELIQFVERREFAPALLDAAPARELTAAASDVMAWTNDVRSLRRDLAAGERANLVLLVRDRLDLDEAAATAAVQRMVADRIDHLLAARRALRRLGPDAHLLGDRVTTAVRGAWDWHHHSTRYAAAPTAP